MSALLTDALDLAVGQRRRQAHAQAAGRVEFHEMAGPLKFLSSRAETLREAYAQRLASHHAFSVSTSQQ